MGCAPSIAWRFPAVPPDIKNIPPLWAPPSSTSNIQFALSKYDKEYINATLLSNIQGYQLTVNTKNRMIVVYSGDTILGVTKRFGETFKIFRPKPNFPGQEPSGKLKRANDAPLYFHSLARRRRMAPNYAESVVGVFRFGNMDQEIYRIENGPPNSFEKTCIDSPTGNESAFWKYQDKKNRVELFQNSGSATPDAALIMLLTIIVDLFAADDMMEKAAGAAAAAVG